MTLSAPTRLDAALPLLDSDDSDIISVDTETLYSNDYSVSDSSYWHYVNDPRFDCYLVSIVGSDFEWVGHPRDFDWEKIHGKKWVSWNRPFDKAVIERCIELGTINFPARCVGRDNDEVWYDEKPSPSRWEDSAPLSVYLRAPRSLAGAVQALYGHTISKDIRNVQMKGKTWRDFPPDMQEKIKHYALEDARWCRRVWVDHAHKWPEHERRIADLLAARGASGIPIDQTGLEADTRAIEQIKFQAEQKIPWRHESPILSRKAVIEECRKHGIEPPKSFAMTDEACSIWEDTYGTTFPWIAAVRDWRRANALLEKYKSLKSRIKPDGRMAYSTFYHGAHTGRDSGAGGFNTKNLPRQPFYYTTDWNLVHKKDEISEIEKHVRKFKTPPDWVRGAIDMRSKFTAAPGHVLAVGDLAQIEARCARWLAKDFKTLALVESGLSIYTAHAARFCGWNGGNEMKHEAPGAYQLAKSRELALGFGVGFFKFLTMARSYVDDAHYNQIFGTPVTNDDKTMFLEYVSKLRNPTVRATYQRQWKNASDFTKNTYVNSFLQVQDFRQKNPELTALWRRLDGELKNSIGETYEVTLPSGRVLSYFNVTQLDGDGIQVRTERGGPFTYTYGPKIFENLCQAMARDVHVEAQLRVADAGIDIILDCYDELCCSAPEDFDPRILENLMTQRPSWARTLPIGAEVELMKHYKK